MPGIVEGRLSDTALTWRRRPPERVPVNAVHRFGECSEDGTGRQRRFRIRWNQAVHAGLLVEDEEPCLHILASREWDHLVARRRLETGEPFAGDIIDDRRWELHAEGRHAGFGDS